jgi:hypothetical protein
MNDEQAIANHLQFIIHYSSFIISPLMRRLEWRGVRRLAQGACGSFPTHKYRR